MLRCAGRSGWKRRDETADDAQEAVAEPSRVTADARLVAAHEFFRKGEANAEGWTMLVGKGRGWESAYRDRWRHDKIVRSTHGVNCTGSCSWNVYVKDGLITWESQPVDYPRTDPDHFDHGPLSDPSRDHLYGSAP
jgi:nitrate reductase alpha subunit